jgi:hypothetical protein
MASMNPHIRDKHSPLEELVMQALRRHGEFNPSSVDGDVSLMMLEFANEVIQEVNEHAYTPDDLDIKPYISLQDAREVPDSIIVLGLLFYYSDQQNSSKVQSASEKYFRTMNQTLYSLYHNKGRPFIKQDHR